MADEEKKLDEKELENIFNIREPLPLHLNDEEQKVVERNINPRNIENFYSLLLSTQEGIDLANSSPGTIGNINAIYQRYEEAKDERDAKVREETLKRIEQDYAREFNFLKEGYDAGDRENNRLRNMFTNAAYKYGTELKFVDDVFNKHENAGARVKQELVDLRNKLYRGDVRLHDVSNYIDYLQTNKGKMLSPKPYKQYTREQLDTIDKILNSNKTDAEKVRDVNGYLGKNVIEIRRDGSLVKTKFEQFKNGIEEQIKNKIKPQIPSSSELNFKHRIDEYLKRVGNVIHREGGDIDENGYPAEIRKKDLDYIKYIFTLLRIPRPTSKYPLNRRDEFYNNLKSYIKTIGYDEKEIEKPMLSNKEQNMAESQDILDRIAKRQETASFLEKGKQKGNKIEFEEKILYFPNNEEDIDELKQIAEQGLLYEINVISGRLRKVKPDQIKIGNEYVKFKVVGGAFAPGYAKNHVLHSNDLGIGVHDKTMYNKIEDIPISFDEFKMYKDKQMKGGSFFGKIWKSKIFDPLRSVRKDVVQSAKNIGKSAVEIGKGKNIVENLGNIGKNIGVGTVRALGDTSKFIQETPVLKDINKQLTKIPGYGTALSVVENVSRSGDALSKGKYGEAINQAAKTIPAIVGGSFTPLHSKHKLGNRSDPFSANKNAGTSADLYYGSIYNEEKVKRQNYFGSAYAPTSIQLKGGKPNYNVVSGPRNYEAPRDPWQEEDLGKNNKILRYDYIDPYKLPKFLAY